MNLRVVILPAKRLADGTHKIRIAISHRGQTRYFPTRFNVPSESNLKSGIVTGVNNASYINQQLRIKMNKIYTICDEASDIEYLTCSQLVSYIGNREEENKPRTLMEVCEKFYNARKGTMAVKTLKGYRYSISLFISFFGEKFMIRQLTAETLLNFRDYMRESRKLSQTTIIIHENRFRAIVNYAKKMRYVSFDSDPFLDVENLCVVSRDCALTIEEIRKIRDVNLDGKAYKRHRFARDIFMLSFYLCGINLVDLLEVDLSGDLLKYQRKKTRNRTRTPAVTEFTIQPEARKLIDESWKKHDYKYSYTSIAAALDSMKDVAKMAGVNKRVIYYSARKSFAQIANELFVKDSVIQYCIGDTVTMSKQVIGFYINVTRKMADIAIRRVFDAVASEKTMDELLAEYMQNPFVM